MSSPFSRRTIALVPSGTAAPAAMTHYSTAADEFHIGCMPGQNFAYNRPRTFPDTAQPSIDEVSNAGRSVRARAACASTPAVGVGQRHLLGR